ncbi:UNVERIFIED_CONTAM: Retrovirus-related Pol polyprotein from transposon TNT 1-94 [Sesamum indicum]
MQFLMGFHENFDKEKSQLLMMDPLPDLEKAFSMVFAVEQQRSVQDQESKRVLVKGMLNKRLYIVRGFVFGNSTASTSFVSSSCTALSECNDTIWHASRSLWTYLVKQKDQVVSTLHTFTTMVETQFAAKAALPLWFWGESVLATTYIMNRTPTQVLHWRIPFELLFGTVPTYSHLKIFGCLCFATNTNPHKSKFQKRAHKCVFLGYSLTQKGYKVYDLEDHTFFVSRDIVFHELVFPFVKEQAANSFECPLLTITAGVDYRDALIPCRICKLKKQ